MPSAADYHHISRSHDTSQDDQQCQFVGWHIGTDKQLDTLPRGLFATRAPSRPNPIGLSIVKLLGIEGHVLTMEGLDLLNGTPLLDIKPYFGDFDRREDVRCGWLDTVRERRVVADNRFAAANSEENHLSK